MIKTVLKFILFIFCAIGIVAIVFLLWALIPDLLFWRFSGWLPKSNITLENRGAFGDSFGGVNALLSGLALIGVIAAIILQRLELKNQQREMREQKVAMQQETFERSFFHFLEAIREKYDSTEHRQFKEVPAERNIGMFHQEVIENYRHRPSVVIAAPFREPDGQRVINIIAKGNDAFIESINNGMRSIDSMYLESYFFLLFAALNLIHQCENLKEKKFYSDILRSQMPDLSVQALCMYLAPDPPMLNGDMGDGKVFKKLIEDYALFANIKGVKQWREYILRYNRSAFGKNRPDIDDIFDNN